MDETSLKNYAIKIIKSKGISNIEIFSKMFDNGLIDRERVLKGCINHYYDFKLKENECNVKNTVLDAAIEFDVSCRTVQNTIYKFRNIRIDF